MGGGNTVAPLDMYKLLAGEMMVLGDNTSPQTCLAGRQGRRGRRGEKIENQDLAVAVYVTVP